MTISIMLNSENPKQLAEFYAQLFGPYKDDEPGWYNWTDNNIFIGPHSDIKGQAKEPARIMLNVDSQDVKGQFETLKNNGATVIAEPYEPSHDDYPNFWIATLADPDGNYIQLCTPWS